jgi:hypothetical protein
MIQAFIMDFFQGSHDHVFTYREWAVAVCTSNLHEFLLSR